MAGIGLGRKVALPRPLPHIAPMNGAAPLPRASPPRPHPLLCRLFFVAGCLLLVLTPAVALLPGPGGIFTFAAGMNLILRHSPWARRRYVWFKRRWPRPGAWADWGLRRASARRRRALAKAAVATPDRRA